MTHRIRKSLSGPAGLGPRIEYRLVVLLCFSVCLVGIAGKRLMGHPAAGDSMASEAFSAAMAVVGYAYTA